MTDTDRNNDKQSGEEESFPPVSSADSTGSANILGSQIGPYKLLSVLGEGGFGVVYIAEQQRPIRRRVALKIIKLGMDTKQVIARFDVERQALALMDHPNIAKVFDTGATDTGRPYFVMELVKGMSITEHCDRQKLSIEDRLQLLIQVCEAVHHAHQKGIIHRDIKPSNILVTIHDDEAVPKIIDFGVAKAISQPLTERTLFTEQGQLIGTPEYMSPEQAGLGGQDIDTRTDIYSLGVLLYELLTGVQPFDPGMLRQAAFGEIQRIIQEEDPPRPSTRLSNLGKEATKVAESRHTEVGTLVKSLHKELEWIPLKAMRKERTHRYRSASEFADDIRHYLNGEPLIAGPESLLYRARKFVRRNRALVTGVAAVMAVLMAGITVSMIFAVGEAEQRKLAETERDRAEREKEVADTSLYFNQIALAQAEYQQANIQKAQKLLQSCNEHLRSWGWYRLRYILDQSERTLHGHKDVVASAVFSPDGKRVVSGSYDGTIKIWDVATGSEIMTIRGHKARVYAVAISPDSQKIASGGHNGNIRLWDAGTGMELSVLKGHSRGRGVSSLQFSPNGKTLASGGYDTKIKLWDVESGLEILTLNKHTSSVTWVDFSPDGNLLASCSHDWTIKLWDIEQGMLLREVPRTHAGFWHRGPPNQVDFSPDGKHIIGTCFDGSVWVLDVDTLENEWFIPRTHKGGGLRATYSPDGTRIASGGELGDLKVWDGSNGELLLTLHGHQRNITSVAFSPDGNRIVSASRDQTVKLWNTQVAKGETLFSAHPAWSVTSIAFSPDGALLVSGGTDSSVRVWVTENWDRLCEFSGSTGYVTAVAFSPDGRYVVSGSYDSFIRIWDAILQKPFPVLEFGGSPGFLYSVQYSPDGKCVISGGSDRLVKVWDAAKGDLLFSLVGHTGSILCVCYSPDGKRIVSGGSDNTIRVWDSETGDHKMTLRGHNRPVKCLVFSPDGSTIASGDYDSVIMLWDSQTGEAKLKLEGHRDTVTMVKFSPDGKRLFSSSVDQSVRVWDTATGVSLMNLGTQLSTEKGPVDALDVSPDGKTVVAGLRYGGMLVVWDSNDPGKRSGTYSVDKLRESAMTVESATSACEMTKWKDWFYLSTLATAYSKVGNFSEAVKWQKEAIELVPKDDPYHQLSSYKTRLRRYESSKPWRFARGEMVTWWKFDEIQAGNVVDSSGNAYDLKLGGGTNLTAGKYGSALQLDGIDDYAELGALNLYSNNITITAWIKRDGEQTESYTGIVYCRDGETVAGIRFGGTTDFEVNNELAYNWNEDQATWGWHSGLIIPDNKWVFVAVVVEPTKATLYLGEDETVSSATNEIKHRMEEFDGITRIGSDPYTDTRYFKGLIDDVRIYSYALSEDEILAIYAGDSPKPTEEHMPSEPNGE